MRTAIGLSCAILVMSAGASACAQAGGAAALPGVRASQVAPDAGLPLAPAAPLDPEVRKILQLLHDRRETLKDFIGKVDYSVNHPVTDETSGKKGTVDFIVDPNKGPIFTVDFTVDTDEEGKPKKSHHQQIIFDGESVTTKDFQSKELIRSRVLKAGDKPGDAVTLNGPMPLPIGINVEDVARTFEATLLPVDPKYPDEVILRLVPRPGRDFPYRRLDIAVDKKLELPTRLVQSAANKDVTTIKLSEIQINTGRARMQDANPPASEGWTVRMGDGGPGGPAK